MPIRRSSADVKPAVGYIRLELRKGSTYGKHFMSLSLPISPPLTTPLPAELLGWPVESGSLKGTDVMMSGSHQIPSDLGHWVTWQRSFGEFGSLSCLIIMEVCWTPYGAGELSSVPRLSVVWRRWLVETSTTGQDRAMMDGEARTLEKFG